MKNMTNLVGLGPSPHILVVLALVYRVEVGECMLPFPQLSNDPGIGCTGQRLA